MSADFERGVSKQAAVYNYLDKDGGHVYVSIHTACQTVCVWEGQWTVNTWYSHDS